MCTRETAALQQPIVGICRCDGLQSAMGEVEVFGQLVLIVLRGSSCLTGPPADGVSTAASGRYLRRLRPYSPSRLAAAQRTPSLRFNSTSAFTSALLPEPWGPCSVTMPEVKYGARRRALAAICSAAVLIVFSCASLSRGSE